jgi:5'-methylthioadenosine phosphorylase
MPHWGVVSGSGLYDIPGLQITDSLKVDTPYGEPSDSFRIGLLSNKEIAFLPRHGTEHTIQPHKINYRANLWGFRELGVKRILSIGASGGISGHMKPGTIAVLDQLIDLTNDRQSTFYDKDEVVHIDFSEPFCPDLRAHLIRSAEQAGLAVTETGTYACMNGPRLETAAEIRALSLMGADMVGMTGMPEAVLARELEICFGGISVITNLAAGITGQRLSTSEVIDTMKSSTGKVTAILVNFFGSELPEAACSCGEALKDAKI